MSTEVKNEEENTTSVNTMRNMVAVAWFPTTKGKSETYITQVSTFTD